METIGKKIRKAIMKIPKDILFTYKDLPIPSGKESAVTQTIYRMLQENTIKRYRKGTFYRPEKGHTGEDQMVSTDSVLQVYLTKDGQKIAYMTGLQLYNALGLTTQHPFVFQIASHLDFPNLGKQGDRLRIQRVKSYVTVTDTNWQYLQFLDLLRYFPIRYLDLKRETVIHYFVSKLKKMSKKERRETIRLSLFYPPRIRAFLGALLEAGGLKEGLEKLKSSLNPMSSYRLHTRRYYLSTAKKWNLYDDFARKPSPIQKTG